jgi:hypothetical protein
MAKLPDMAGPDFNGDCFGLSYFQVSEEKVFHKIDSYEAARSVKIGRFIF